MKAERYKILDGQKLAYGCTTGTCAAAAARAAAQMLLAGEEIAEVLVHTPLGMDFTLPIEKTERTNSYVNCMVRKDAGDDPDVTNGVEVWAKVELELSADILIRGGTGIGVVTRPGLDQPIGEWAINSGPRKQIREQLLQVCENCGYEGGLTVTISIPQGAELAAKTFNPKLGIEGGISVLGTTGVVEPMSEQALVDTIRTELRMHAAERPDDVLLLAPGNYGQEFLLQEYGISVEESVKCSNFVEQTFQMAADLEIRRILFTGHLGKLIKVAGGCGNTHSRYGDGRMETLADLARQAGAGREMREQIMACVMTPAAVEILENAGLCEKVMQLAADRVKGYAEQFGRGQIQVEVILFTREQGLLAQTGLAQDFCAAWKNREV